MGPMGPMGPMGLVVADVAFELRTGGQDAFTGLVQFTPLVSHI